MSLQTSPITLVPKTELYTVYIFTYHFTNYCFVYFKLYKLC